KERDGLKDRSPESLLPADKAQLDELNTELAPAEEKINELQRQWKGQTVLGRVGKAIEPVVRPLGWDWRIGMAALASFPAREVMVGTLGIIYNLGSGDVDELKGSLGKALTEATWEDDPQRKVFTVPTALSLMVFF